MQVTGPASIWNHIGDLQVHGFSGLSSVIVYVNNESIGNDVWFDDLNISYYSGGVLEQNHYYPYGLTLSEQAAGATEQPIKFQSQQHENDFGINMYSFKYREHDPTIGRFWQIDPLADKYAYNSTYAFSENKVTGHVELEGLESMPINPSAMLWRSAGISSSTDAGEFVQDVGKEALKPQNWLSAGATVGAIAAGVAVGVFTEGVGLALLGEMSLASAETTMSTETMATMRNTTSLAKSSTSNTILKPSYIADVDGGVYPVPKNAEGPKPVENGKGFQYTGGKGGDNGQVSTLRIMDATPAKGNSPAYPNGYVKYENVNRQGIDGYTGKTVSRQEAHIPRGKCEINPEIQ